jgi:hypothetical protein
MIALLVFAALAGLTLTIAQVAVHLPPASKAWGEVALLHRRRVSSHTESGAGD